MSISHAIEALRADFDDKHAHILHTRPSMTSAQRLTAAREGRRVQEAISNLERAYHRYLRLAETSFEV